MTEDGTILRLMDRKKWKRLDHYDSELSTSTYLDICEVPLSVNEVISKLHSEGYMDCRDIGNVVYVLITTHPGYDEDIARHIAEDFFGVEPTTKSTGS